MTLLQGRKRHFQPIELAHPRHGASNLFSSARRSFSSHGVKRMTNVVAGHAVIAVSVVDVIRVAAEAKLRMTLMTNQALDPNTLIL